MAPHALFPLLAMAEQQKLCSRWHLAIALVLRLTLTCPSTTCLLLLTAASSLSLLTKQLFPNQLTRSLSKSLARQELTTPFPRAKKPLILHTCRRYGKAHLRAYSPTEAPAIRAPRAHRLHLSPTTVPPKSAFKLSMTEQPLHIRALLSLSSLAITANTTVHVPSARRAL